MTWLTPSLGIIAASFAVPSLLILYFLKLRRRDVEISTTLLWKKSVMDMQANAPFQKLRKNILLLLQLLILAAILCALAQPQFSGQAIIGQTHVLMIDRSASMGAEDVPAGTGKVMTRLEQAKKDALALVSSLREGGLLSRGEADKAMVIAFDESATVVQSFTSDKQALRNAIDSILPGEGPTSLKLAIELARANAPLKPNIDDDGTISGTASISSIPLTMHLFSDGRIPDAASMDIGPSRDATRDDAVGNTVIYHAVGSELAPNLGIVAVRAERGFDNPNKLTVFVSLINNQATPRGVDVELIVDRQAAALRTVNVGAATMGNPTVASSGGGGARTSAAGSDNANANVISPGVGGTIFQLDRADGAIMQVNLREPGTPEPPTGDVLAVDNRAYLAVPPAKRLSVGLVTRGSLVLSSLFEGLPVRTTQLTPDAFEQQLKDSLLSDFDVIVLDGYLPTTGVGSSGLPPGRYLVLGAVPIAEGNGLTDKGKGPPTSIIEWSRDHPALRSVGLENVQMFESRLVEVEPGKATTTLALCDKGPAIVEIATAETRAIVVPSNPMDGNWPFDVSFVVFTASAMNYLGGDDGASGGSLRSVQPGRTLADRLPVGTKAATLEGPGGETTALTPAADGRIVFGPIARTGLYTVSYPGTPGPSDVSMGEGTAARVFTANLFDMAESDVRVAKEVPFASTVAAAEERQSAKADRKLWPYLLMAALAVVMVEWFIYNRKVHI